MANDYYISAGIPPKKTSGAATANSYYISAGLQPEIEVAAGRTTKNTDAYPLGVNVGMSWRMPSNYL